MAQVETPFVIGVIREKEKSFLESDEYTRLIDAADAGSSERSLIDTAYGTWLEREKQVGRALSAFLAEEWQWLCDVVDDEKVLQFLAARFDGLNVAGMLLDRAAGRDSLRSWSDLGVVDREVMEQCLQADGDIDYLSTPLIWEEFVRAELEAISEEGWRAGEMLTRVKDQVVRVWEKSANSKLTRNLLQLWAQHLQYDESWRVEAGDVSEAEVAAPDFMSEEAVKSLREAKDATAYELEWDAQVVQLLRPAKLETVGSDPIVAYWLARQLEVKTIRLLLAGKTSGMQSESLRDMIRPLYLETT